MKIYVKFEIPKTIREFLKLFFSSYHNGYLLNVATYNDKDCTDVQCGPNRYRSFDDLLDCVNTYYPGTTHKELMEILVNTILVNETTGNRHYLYTFYCNDIGRAVIIFHTEIQLIHKSGNRNGAYSWEELFKMIGINTEEDLIKKKLELIGRKLEEDRVEVNA